LFPFVLLHSDELTEVLGAAALAPKVMMPGMECTHVGSIVSQILNFLTNFNYISRLHHKTTGPEKPKGNGGTSGAQQTEQDERKVTVELLVHN
jgi:hypothetical protein